MKIIKGDSLKVLKTLDTESIDCIITSPPYWQLRDYNISGQIGLEENIEEYIEKLMLIMDELYRVLKKSGTFFLNIGDTYSNVNSKFSKRSNKKRGKENTFKTIPRKTNIQRKSKMMIPERLCIKMIDQGWILRNEIIWHKPNVLPESLNDRFTNDFEKIFFFTKNQKYYFKKRYEPYSEKTLNGFKDGVMPTGKKKMLEAGESKTAMKRIDKPWKTIYNENGRNMRTVWSIATKGIKEGHYASFPEELVKRCLLAGCPIDGIVLDPFLGSGTTLKVAKSLNLNGVGVELKKEYIEIAVSRIGEGLFNKIEVDYESFNVNKA
jgi:site-specific DNA-methyltransferase (adenine-specific)